MEDREAPHVLDRLAISPHSSGSRKSGISRMITALATLLSAEKAFYGWWRQARGFREGYVLRGCLLSAVSWQVNMSAVVYLSGPGIKPPVPLQALCWPSHLQHGSSP